MTGRLRDDYIMRQVKGIAAMLARVIGLRREGSIEEASVQLDRAFGLLLEDQVDLIRRIDSATAATLLGNPERIVMYARLLQEEACQGSSSFPRSAEMVIEALRRDPGNAEAQALLKELKTAVAPHQLPLRYRSEFA